MGYSSIAEIVFLSSSFLDFDLELGVRFVL